MKRSFRNFRGWLALLLMVVLAVTLATPAPAHVGTRVGHLFSEHILPRIGALPDCPAGQAFRGMNSDGTPICDLGPAIISGFKDQFRLTTPAGQLTRVGRLSLPVGKYSITAKLYTTVPLPSGELERVKCELVAGGDRDETIAAFDALYDSHTLALNVVHEFTSEGVADLNCGFIQTAGDSHLRFIKMTAVGGTSLRNAGL